MIIGATSYTGNNQIKPPMVTPMTATKPSVDSVKTVPLTNTKGQPQALNPRR